MSLLIFGLIAFLGFTILSKGYFSFQPEGKRFENNTAQVMEYLTAQQDQLVDFKADELELLSGNKLKDRKSSLFSTKSEGILLSIYHEPFIAYKKIFHNNDLKTGVLGVATKNNRFLYIMKKDHVDIFINQKPIGTIKGSGKLINADNRVVMGHYDIKPQSGTYLVHVFDTPEAEVKIDFGHDNIPQRIVSVFGVPEKEIYNTVEILAYYLVGLTVK